MAATNLEIKGEYFYILKYEIILELQVQIDKLYILKVIKHNFNQFM